MDKGPSIGWSYRHIYPRADSELVEEEIKCKHPLCWSGEHGIELFNSWNMFAEEQKQLANYWMRFENFGKPYSNELIAVWELHNLRQGTLSLKEFIAKLRILVKKANYPVEHNKAIPASKCLELCDVRDQPHPFQLKKNISPERISRRVYYLCWMLPRSPIPHTNQP